MKWKSVLRIVDLAADIGLTIGAIGGLLVRDYGLATVAVLGLILFELGRIKRELRRQRPPYVFSSSGHLSVHAGNQETR